MSQPNAFAPGPAGETFLGSNDTPEFPDDPAFAVAPDDFDGVDGVDAAHVDESPKDAEILAKDDVADEPAAEAATETAEAEVPASTEDTVVFDADTLKEAKEVYGWDENYAKTYSSPDDLRRAMAAADRFLTSQFRAPQPQYDPQQPQAPAAPVTQADVTAAKAAVEKFKLELDPDTYDESTRKQLAGLNDHYHGLTETLHTQLQQTQARAAALEEQFHQITSANQAAEAARFEQEVETSFASLGDEWSDTFGKGGWRQLPPNSPQLLNRVKVAEEMAVLRFAEAQRNRQPTNAELQKRAINALFSDQIKTHARKEILSKVADRQTQSAARPAGRQPRAKTQEQMAIAGINEWLKGQGSNAPDFDDGEF